MFCEKCFQFFISWVRELASASGMKGCGANVSLETWQQLILRHLACSIVCYFKMLIRIITSLVFHFINYLRPWCISLGFSSAAVLAWCTYAWEFLPVLIRRSWVSREGNPQSPRRANTYDRFIHFVFLMMGDGTHKIINTYYANEEPSISISMSTSTM